MTNINEVINLQPFNEIILHVCKYDKKNQKYISFTPQISHNVVKGIEKIILNYLSLFIDFDMVSYNPIGALDKTIETADVNYSESISSLLCELENPRTGQVIPKDVEFLVYEINLNNNKIYFFRRHQKGKSLRQGLIAQLLNNEYDKIDEQDVLFLDDKIDFLILEEEIIIIQHIAFERIFQLEDDFFKSAQKVLEKQSFKDNIENYDLFKEEMLSNKSFTRRLAKLEEKNSADLFIQKIEKTKEVIKKFNLDIEVKNEKLVYSEKSQLGDFVNFMQDAYYLTLIGDTPGVDERR